MKIKGVVVNIVVHHPDVISSLHTEALIAQVLKILATGSLKLSASPDIALTRRVTSPKAMFPPQG